MYTFERYFLQGTTVADTKTDQLYSFETKWGAKLFYDQVTEFEQKGYISTGTICSGGGITFNNITTISNFILTMGNEEYKLPLNKKPNTIQRLFLRLMGFKKA